MDQDELKSFRAEFSTIDVRDSIRLRKWFTDYPELTVLERCMISGRSEVTITRWKKRVGATPLVAVETNNGLLITTRRPPRQRLIYHQDSNITIPDDWANNHDWLKQQYSRMSERELSRIIGCSRDKVATALRRAKINRRTLRESTRTRHIAYSREWIYHHYYECNFGLRKCAKLAGVGVTTFLQWMSKFEIPTRGPQDAAFLVQKIRKNSKRR